MKIEIGDLELVEKASLAVPKDESAVISFELGQWSIVIRIKFVITSGKAEDRAIAIKSDSGEAVIEFLNWNNVLGTVTKEPVRLGKTNDGRELRFMAVHELVGDVNCLHIYFLLQKKRGGVND